MREILFRGKRINNDEWVEGSLWIHGEIARIFVVGDFPDCCDWVEVDPSTVCQYTGITAKGKRIFEGDVVKRTYIFSKESECGVVHWNDVFSGWHISRCEGLNGDGIVKKYEVLGNIHDNPELLEGEA